MLHHANYGSLFWPTCVKPTSSHHILRLALILSSYLRLDLGRAITQAVSRRLPGFDPRSSHLGFVVDKMALWKSSSEYFRFSCQVSFHQMLHIHLSSGAGTISQLVTDVPIGLGLTLLHEKKMCLGLSTSLLPSAFRATILCKFPGMRVTWPAYFIMLDLINLKIYHESAYIEAPYYAIFTSPYYLTLSSTYSPNNNCKKASLRLHSSSLAYRLSSVFRVPSRVPLFPLV
jgi:hypothetical protein